MQDQFLALEYVRKRRHGHSREWIHQEIMIRHADLNEAELLEIGMEAVRLRIDGYPLVFI